MSGKIPVLVDIDGVLKLGGKPAGGMKEFLQFLKENDLDVCIISNTTLTTSADQKEFFDEQNIDLSFPVLTASNAALNYVKKNYNKAAVYCTEHVLEIFEEINQPEEAEVVVMGDMQKEWNYEVLTEIFRKVKNGADLVAMQKNRYWNTPDEGYLLDVGPFVAAIEYATGKEATLIGKPSKLYFESALNEIGSGIDNPFIMIGDDVETDIGATQKFGGTGILMYTGKTEYPLPDDFHIKPVYEAQNLDEAAEIISGIIK